MLICPTVMILIWTVFLVARRIARPPQASHEVLFAEQPSLLMQLVPILIICFLAVLGISMGISALGRGIGGGIKLHWLPQQRLPQQRLLSHRRLLPPPLLALLLLSSTTTTTTLQQHLHLPPQQRLLPIQQLQLLPL